MDVSQRDRIASWSARMVANVIGVKKPPWMEMYQWWRLWHRTGLCNMNVLTAIRDRALTWAGHCQIGLQRDPCEGLTVSRSSVVEMATAPLERSGEGQLVLSAPKTIPNLHGVGRGFQVYLTRRWLCGTSPNVHGLAPTCSRSWALETVYKIWKEPSLGVANAMAPMSGVDRSDKDLGATCFVDLDGSTKEHKENWKILEDGCSEPDHTNRNNGIQKFETDKSDGVRVRAEGFSGI